MKIPIGQDYTFTIRVLQEDSMNSKDLTGLRNVGFAVYTLDGKTKKIEISGAPGSPSPDGFSHIVSAENGKLSIRINGNATSRLEENNGGPADRYYLKPGYRGSIILTFDDTTEIITVIKEISAVGV